MFKRKMMDVVKNLLRSAVNRLGFDVVRLRNSHGDPSTHLLNVFVVHDIDCVIDVGANSGQYGKLLRRLGFKGHIISFEPVKSVYDLLAANARGDDKWQCHNLALGDKDELKTLNVYKSTVFSSFLEASEYSKKIWQSLETVSPEEVRVARLDGIFADLVGHTGCKNYFLKMDTQGYDKNVFDGAVGCLEHVRGLQSELSLIPVYDGMSNAYDVLTEFHKRGFQISGMYPINRDVSSLAVIEYDCVLVRGLGTGNHIENK